MTIKHITREALEQALADTNTKHGYQLRWKDGPTPLNAARTRWQVTIRSQLSGIRGASVSASGRNSPSASWHAHGHFFEAVLSLSPSAEIKTGLHGAKVINAAGGNWQDSNVGPACAPTLMSNLSIL